MIKPTHVKTHPIFLVHDIIIVCPDAFAFIQVDIYIYMDVLLLNDNQNCAPFPTVSLIITSKWSYRARVFMHALSV